MDHWNYRLLFNGSENPDDAEWWIGEVYWDGGKPVAWSGPTARWLAPLAPKGETIEEVHSDLQRMKTALEGEILVEVTRHRPARRELITLEEWRRLNDV